MNRSSALVYKAYEPEIRQGLAEKAKYITNLGYGTGASLKPSLYDKPVYQELNKIPVEEQINMLNRQIEMNNILIQQHPELRKAPTQEELKRQYLEQLYMEDFPKNAELT